MASLNEAVGCASIVTFAAPLAGVTRDDRGIVACPSPRGAAMSDWIWLCVRARL